MMRTEDDARVSLDDTFTDGTPSPDNSKKGSDRVGSPSKAKRKSKRSTKSPPAGLGALLRGAFGPLFPVVGSVSWESAGTSWVFPDLLHLFWRLLSFGVLLGLYFSLTQRGLIHSFSTDVYTFALLASALLLLPPAALLLAGPHEDDLDAAGVRWLWSLVTGVLQAAATHATFMVGIYLIVVPKPLVVHITPAALLLGELAIGCAVPRLSYTFGGAIAMAIYVAVARAGKTDGVGVWLPTMIIKRGGEMYAAVVAAYLLTGLGIVVVGRARAQLAWWVETRGERDDNGVGPEIEW